MRRLSRQCLRKQLQCQRRRHRRSRSRTMILLDSVPTFIFVTLAFLHLCLRLPPPKNLRRRLRRSQSLRLRRPSEHVPAHTSRGAFVECSNLSPNIQVGRMAGRRRVHSIVAHRRLRNARSFLVQSPAPPNIWRKPGLSRRHGVWRPILSLANTSTSPSGRWQGHA